MRQHEPSRTAQRVALRRAAHQLLDHPLVFEDPLALRIVGRQQADALRRDPAEHERGRLAPYLRAFLAVRSRIAEETLAGAVRAGVTQYVVLGAGLDTFAHRNPYPGLRVFEVDHSATQGWKRELLLEEGLAPPDSLSWVPVDFERDELARELERAGFRREAGAFFSWLGVTPYVDEAAVLATLRYAASVAGPYGGIVFDYGVAPSSLGVRQRIAFEAMAERVAAAGEPWRTFFEPAALRGHLLAVGFADVEDLDGDALNARYFAARSDGLRVGSVGRIVTARGAPAPDAR